MRAPGQGRDGDFDEQRWCLHCGKPERENRPEVIVVGSPFCKCPKPERLFQYEYGRYLEHARSKCEDKQIALVVGVLFLLAVVMGLLAGRFQ